MAMSDAQRAREYRKRKAAARPVTAETEHSRKIVSGISGERNLTVSEQELVRQIGRVIAELEELDTILRHRTTDWLQTAIEEVEEIMGPGVQVFLNPDPMLAAVDRKRTLLKGLISELRQHRALAERLGAGNAAPTAPVPLPQPASLSVAPDGDFELFGAG